MITVSESAKSKIVQLMNEEGFSPETDYVRVGVKSGGCSGLSYELKFDKQQADGDKLFEDNFLEKSTFFKFPSIKNVSNLVRI